MFTGIVERVGLVAAVDDSTGVRRMRLTAADLGELEIGASIAVDGVCLTAVETGVDTVTVDIVPETLDRTTLGSVVPGDRVNLERPMPASGRFDGHIVQGHVDGVGTITGLETGEDGAVTMTVEAPAHLMRYVVEKGSVTIDGVSLTVASLGLGTLTVALIPHTLDVTNLGLRNPGERVNLEMDVLAKYVERLVRTDG